MLTGRFSRSGQQAGNQFLTLKRFAIAVFLDDTILDVLEPLAAGEALPAIEALTSSPDDVSFLALARVNHLVAKMAAIRALHRAPFCSG